MAHPHLGAGEAAARRRPPSGLETLIAPVSVASFLTDHWERAPLLIHRDDPAYYADILTLADIDSVLAWSSLNDGDLRLVADGDETPITQLLPDTVEGKANGIEAIYARYRAGATVNLIFLHERWQPLADLCRRVATELDAPVHGNVYLTPPASRGLTPHHDTHDVFVLQLHGTKHWLLYPPQTELPLQGQHYHLPEEGPGEPTHDFVLRPGDMAYLPRGTVHMATANEEPSLHLTVGVNPVRWGTVLQAAVERAVTGDVRFRAALPVGFVGSEDVQESAARQLRELVDVLRDEISPKDAIGRMATRTLQRRQPTLVGHLLDLDALPSVGLETVLRRRPDVQWRLRRDDDEVHLEFHGKVLDLPAYVEEELAFMIKADSFTGQDIPGSLDDAGRLVLLRQLLQEGFLTTL